jgi:hypothetical protein
MPLACPKCGSTDLAFDYDGVVTINVVDGELASVNVGGVLDVSPDQLFCRGGCGVEIRPLTEAHMDLSEHASDVIADLLAGADRQLLDDLSNGFSRYDTEIVCTKCHHSLRKEDDGHWLRRSGPRRPENRIDLAVCIDGGSHEPTRRKA